jgi:hypothetical protein
MSNTQSTIWQTKAAQLGLAGSRKRRCILALTVVDGRNHVEGLGHHVDVVCNVGSLIKQTHSGVSVERVSICGLEKCWPC